MSISLGPQDAWWRRTGRSTSDPTPSHEGPTPRRPPRDTLDRGFLRSRNASTRAVHRRCVELPASKLRILVIVPGTIGEAMAGPEIRGWELAQALARHAAVSVACDVGRSESRAGMRLTPGTRRNLLREVREHDAVLAPWLHPFLFLWLSRSSTILLSDLYDVSELELVHKRDSERVRDEIAAVVRLTCIQQRFADVIITGGHRQADAVKAQLQRSRSRGRIPPRLKVVPFGLPAPVEHVSRGTLRRALPGVGPDDPLILWWGSIWSWLDPTTAIHAVRLLVADRPNIRLVFTSGEPDRAARMELTATEEARALASDLGLLGSTVHFYDQWVPYTARAGILMDADVGLTLHRDAAEAHMATRARYLDYLWCGVPCVLGDGDEMAAELEAAGLARTVPIGDPVAVAEAVTQMLDPARARAARRAAVPAATDRSWVAMARPLLAAIAECREEKTLRHRRPVATAVAAGRYYASMSASRVRMRARGIGRRCVARLRGR